MKVILTEHQIKKLVNEITSPLDIDIKDNPLYNLRTDLEKEAPTLVKFAKSMADNSLSGKIDTVKNIVNIITTKKPFIPKNDKPMHPLGHRRPITSKFGKRSSSVGSSDHKGIDISTSSGSPVYAPLDGIVISARDTTPNGCGGFIQLSHLTMKTKFCHLRQFVVKQGDNVKKGEVIGYSGGAPSDPMHGTSTGSHLHYEILNREDVAVDPSQFQQGLV